MVRGDDGDAAVARRQAEQFRRRYPDWGRYGLSAFVAEDEAAIDDLAADQLERFPVVLVFERRVPDAAGFEILPTFRSPHVTIAFTDLDATAQLQILEHVRLGNPYHEPDPGDR